ncbi:MAG: autotransporter-associated beta strand repeat-containing protein, partial [Thermoguttaceae bacterium]
MRLRLKLVACATVVSCLLAIVIFPTARAGAQSITIGPSTPVNGGNQDGWASNEVTEAGTSTAGTAGAYSYSFTNTGSTDLLFTPQNFEWFSTGGTGNIVTPFVVLLQDPNLADANGQTVLSIGATQTNQANGLQTASYGGNAFTLVPGQELAIGFLDADAAGNNGTGSVVSFFNGAPSGGAWYTGGQNPGTYNGQAPTAVGTVIGTANSTTNRSYQFNISFTPSVGDSNPGTWTGLGGPTLDNTTVNFALNASSGPLSQGNLATVLSSTNANSISFGDTYSANGATTPVAQSNLTVAAGGISPSLPIVFRNNSVNYTINSSDAVGISGSTSVTLAGTGMVTLTGTHTYTGNTLIMTGTLQLGDGKGNDASLATSGITNNSSLIYNVSSSQSATYPITGTGSLQKTGPGTLTLSAGSTYTGGSTISKGTLIAGGVLGYAPINIASGAQLGVSQTGNVGLTSLYITPAAGLPNVNGAIPYFDSLSGLQSQFTSQTPNATTITPTLNVEDQNGYTGGVNFPAPYNNKSSDNFLGYLTGMINIPTTGSYTFGLASDDGTVLYIDGNGVVNDNYYQGYNGGNNNAGNFKPQNTSAPITLTAGEHSIVLGYYQGGGGYMFEAGIQGPSDGGNWQDIGTSEYPLTPDLVTGSLTGSGSVSLATGNLIFGADGTNQTFSGQISGVGGLFKLGAGQQTLTGTNTFTGTTTIGGGTLQVGNGAPIGATSGVSLLNNATLALNHAGAVVFNPAITGAGNLYKDGPGTLTLTNYNTFSGPTTINNGNVVAANVTALGVGTVTLTGSSKLTLAVPSTPAGHVSQYYDLNPSASWNNQSIQAANALLDGTTPSLLQMAFTPGTGDQGTSFFYPGSYSGTGTLFASNYQSSLSAQTFFVRWTGAINIPVTGNYTFTTSSDDGSLLGIDGTTVVQNNYAQGGGADGVARSGSIYLTAGLHAMTTIFNQGGGGYVMEASVSSSVAGIAQEDIPASMLQTTNSLYLGGLQGSGPVDLAGNSLMVGWNDANTTYSGSIGDSVGGGQFFKAGDGSLTLTGSNTYAGTTNVDGGTLIIGSGGTSGSINATSNFVVNSTLAFNHSDNIVLSKVISGNGGLSQLGSGVLTVIASNTYTGPTNVSGGTLQVGNGGSGASIGGTSGVTLANNSALVFNHADNVTFGAPVTGSGSLTKTGSGTLTVTAASSYSGPTYINQGKLQLQVNQVAVNGFGPLGDGTGWTGQSTQNGTAYTLPTFASNILTLTDNASAGGEATSAFYNTKVPVAGAFTANFTYTPSGNIGADGTAFVLQNAAAGAGALGGSGGALGYGGIQPSAAVEINIYGGNQIGTNYNTNGTTGKYQATGNVNVASGDPIQVNLSYDGSNYLVETLTDESNTALTFSTTYSVGSLAATVGGNTAYLGFTGGDGGAVSTQEVSGFSYNFVGGNLLPTTTPVIMSAGSTFDLNGVNQQVGSLSGLGTVTNSGTSDVTLTLATSGNAAFGGAIQDGATNITNLTMIGAGTQVLYGANTYTGVTTISAGTLQLGDGNGHDASMATSSIIDNSALVYNVFASQTANYPISGNGSLTKAGTGKLTLTASNSYTGATNVNSGSLILGTSSALAAASPVNINGGTLALVGGAQLPSQSIMIQPGGVLDSTAASSPFSLAAGQTLSAGRSSAPAIDLSGSVTLNGGVVDIGIGQGTVATLTQGNGTFALSGGTINYDLTNKSTSNGGSNDVIDASHLAINGPTTLLVNALNLSLGNGIYPLFNFSTLSGGTSNLNLEFSNLTTNGTRQMFSFITTGTSNAAVEIDVTGNPANLIWTGSTSNAWDVIGTKNWNNAGTSDYFYNNDFVTFNDTAKTGNVSVVGNVSPSSITFNNSSLTYTLSGSGSITGPTGLTKMGAAAVVLANSNGNQYTGATAINGGALVLGSANAVQNSTVSVNVNNGLGFAPGVVTFNAGAISGAGALALADTNGGAVTLSVGGNGASTTYSGAISGPGGLTTAGGTMLLTGNNSYSGLTTLTAGAVQLGNANAVQNSTVAVNVDNGLLFSSGIGTFNVGGLSGGNVLGLLDTSSSAVTLNVGGNGQSTTFSGTLSGAGA